MSPPGWSTGKQTEGAPFGGAVGTGGSRADNGQTNNQPPPQPTTAPHHHSVKRQRSSQPQGGSSHCTDPVAVWSRGTGGETTSCVCSSGVGT